MNTYLVTIQHDHGTLKIQINASSKQAARKIAADYEGCPESAIKSVTLITARSQGGETPK